VPVPDVVEDGDEEQPDEQPPADDGEADVDADDLDEIEAPDEVAEVELTDDDLEGQASDLFTGTEDGATDGGDTDGDESDESGDESEDDSEPGDALGDLGDRGESLESTVNEGAARLAVVGLEDDDEKDALEDEFTEVFEAFRLGYFGTRFMEEYVFTSEDGEVEPTWGLLGASLCCLAVVVHMRPDGDEMVDRAKGAVENIAGGTL
jgi:hypothetical protein